MAKLKNTLICIFSVALALILVVTSVSSKGYAQTPEQVLTEAPAAEQAVGPANDQAEEPSADESLASDEVDGAVALGSESAELPQHETLTEDETEQNLQEYNEALAEEPAAQSSVAYVSTYQELASATANADVDTLVLTADIAVTAHITIPASKPLLTIDGQGSYTLEQQGSYTFTSSSTQQAVYTFKNLSIIGRSYYGIVWCTATLRAPTLVLEDVSYSGPQLLYNRYGTAEFYGANDVVIQQNGSNSQTAQEVGEIHGFTVYGSLDLVSTATASSFFWMFPVGTEKPYLTIAHSGKARFSTQVNLTSRGFFWIEGTAYNVVLSVEEGAHLVLDLTGYNTLSTSEAHRIDSLYVGKNAFVSFDFAGGIVLSNTLYVDEGAELHLTYRNNPATGAAATTLPLFRFLRTANTAPLITLNNPKRVELAVEPTNRALFSTAYANPLQIITSKVSYWDSFSAAQQDDAPTQSWSSEDIGAFVATIFLRAGQDSLQSITATDEEFAAQFNPASARVIHIGTKETEWISVRIPVKMLFGTLEEHGEGAVISPVYEIQNESAVPLEIALAEFGVNESDGIALLPDLSAERTDHDLKLDLLVEESLAIEYLHPESVAEGHSPVLETLAPNERIQLSLGGTYFGTFEKDITYKPNYSLVWSFTPKI